MRMRVMARRSTNPKVTFTRTSEDWYDVSVNGVVVGWLNREADDFVDRGILQSSSYELYVWTFTAENDDFDACVPKSLSRDGVKWAQIRKSVRAFLATPMAKAFL